MDLADGPLERAAPADRQAFIDPQEIGQVEGVGALLVLGEALHDLQRQLAAEADAEHRTGDHLGGQDRHLGRHVDGLAGRPAGPCLRRLRRGGLDMGAELGEPLLVHQIGHQRPAPAPCLPVGDEETVAQQGLQRPPHLRALALEGVALRGQHLAHAVG